MAKDARKQHTFWNHPVTLFCVVLGTVYLLFQTYGIFARQGYTNELLTKSVMERSALMTDYEKSQERVALLQTALGKDMFQREKQNYVEEGEEIFVIVKEDKGSAGDLPLEKKETWLKKIIPFY